MLSIEELQKDFGNVTGRFGNATGPDILQYKYFYSY